MYVDSASMRLIEEPEDFDVLCTCNMFGDILSDEAAQLIGGLGMAPGANIGDNFALFEPIHGCAPNIAGKHTANPLSMILSAKMMLEWLGEKYNDKKCLQAAAAIEKAAVKTLASGVNPFQTLGGKPQQWEWLKLLLQRLTALKLVKTMTTPNPRFIRIFDTTLRDGEQTPGVSLTAEDKIEIARQLSKLGVDIIEAGFPSSSDGERKVVKEIAKLGFNF